MKKIKLFYIIGILMISSCSSDEDAISESNSIVGIWKPIKRVTVCSENKEVIDFNSCVQNGRLTYKENGEFNEDTYTLGNNCNLTIQENGIWKMENNKLNIKYSDDTSFTEAPFFELSENSLKIGN